MPTNEELIESLRFLIELMGEEGMLDPSDNGLKSWNEPYRSKLVKVLEQVKNSTSSHR